MSALKRAFRSLHSPGGSATCLTRVSRITVRQAPRTGAVAAHDVPDISRSRGEIGMLAPLPFDEAIMRTARWHAARAGSGIS